MFVAWLAPTVVTRSYPLVLIHGGGGQGTDWLGTPDGRSGWAARLVEAGFAVYVVDRCGHGRSPYHPDVIGPMGEQFPYEAAQALFLPEQKHDAAAQWTYGREVGAEGLDQMVCGMGPLPADLAESQRMDADRLARLLDILGPTILITHSAGGPVGWLAADRRPELVVGVAAIEPLGPPFVDFPGIGKLSWGLTAAPMNVQPPLDHPWEAEHADPGTLRIPSLESLPITVVSGQRSSFADAAPRTVDFLTDAGADAAHMSLPDHGIRGNGHGLILEANSDETVAPVIDWIAIQDAKGVGP